MKKFIFLLVVSSMLLVMGCGNEEVKNESSYNQNEVIANSSVEKPYVEKPYQPQQGEVFVGHSDYNDRDCYLLESSIRQNDDKGVNCKIKMAKSFNDIEYLEYKFQGKGTMNFSTNEGFTSIADEYQTPIEYNIYKTLVQYVDMSEVDNTLHITSEEFQRKYSESLNHSLPSNFKNIRESLKIKSIVSEENAVEFEIGNKNLSIMASKDSKSGYIDYLNVMVNSPTASNHFMIVSVFSINTISGKNDDKWSAGVFANLMEKAQENKENFEVGSTNIESGKAEIVENDIVYRITLTPAYWVFSAKNVNSPNK